MATAFSVELASAFSTGTASGGLAGAPVQTRGNRRKEFTFTIPASGAGSTAADIVVLGVFDVTARIRAIKLINGAMGAGVTLSLGKIDPNNSANTDATHYLDATDVSVAGSVDAVKNLPEQIGTDPAGDQSTGQTVPYFGQANIQITATIGGTPTTAAVFRGYIEIADRPGGYA